MPFEIFSERKNGETNSKYAYRLLRESIMSFKLLPGEALDETVISEQFGTSRTPVREALILLKNEKLVDILPQKGSKVSFIDLNLVRQGYFTRRVIETAIFKETAGTLSPEQLRNMKTNLQLQEQEINREATMSDYFFDLDNEMHCMLYEFSHKMDVWYCVHNIGSHYDRVRYLDTRENDINRETDRRTLNRRVDERTLQELYLPAFETAVRDGQPRAVVCSAGQLNGTRICEDTALLTDTLRGAWGFAGAVLAEPGAVQDPARTLAAGVDFAPADAGRLVDAVQSGALDESVLNRAASNIIRILLAASTQPSPADRDRTADRSLAVELAKQSGVLLRNLGALPLHKGQKVAYIGAFADHPRYSAGHPRAPQVTSAIDAAVLHGRKIHYIEGFPADRDQRDEAEFLRAVAAAEAADAAVIFAGLPECAELAAADRRHMRLPECQNNLIARVAAVQKNTVVVLHTSGPVECPWADDVSSVLCMYLAGEGLGEATDALLWGDADPCGRLPETWPLRLEDTPCYLDFPGDGVTADYREGVYVGYRWYDARKMPVRWPFGHGLSYTGYVYRGAALDADTLTPGGTVTARVTVKNSGAMRGAEVVQLYVADATGAPVPGGRVPQALRRFAKIDLQPGEEREVVFTLTPQDISRYSPELHAWCAAPGRYEIRIGHSSRDIRAVLALQYTDAKI